MEQFGSVEPRSRDSKDEKKDMNLVLEGGLAIGRLPGKLQGLVRDNWLSMLEVAITKKTKDGLIDDAIPETLREFGVDERDKDVYGAHRRFLFEFFLNNKEAQSESLARLEAGRRSE